MSSSTFTISGTKHIMAGCAKEQDDMVDFRKRSSGVAMEEGARAELEMVWTREAMHEVKKEETQETSVKVTGCCEAKDEGDDVDDDDAEDRSKEQQDARADKSSATAERTMSDECVHSIDVACTNGAHEAGA